ncbi:MAG: acyl-CoA mutase large subunit family protein [Opitutales bacterium]|nr:acyl-CoA mutase large subunit family protein [Opitutales bacterium]
MDDSKITKKKGLALAEAFPPADDAAWRAEAEAILKGTPFEKALITPTYEGFSLDPIYSASGADALPHRQETPGAGLRVRGQSAAGYHGKGWKISQEIIEGTPESFSKVARAELAGGQNELNIWFDLPTRTGHDPLGEVTPGIARCGVSASTLADFESLFEGIHLNMISVFLRAGHAPAAVFALFAALARKRGHDLVELEGAVECDPLHMHLAPGGGIRPWSVLLDEMEGLLRTGLTTLPRFHMVTVQGHGYHDAGASGAQELAFVLASALTYLREMEARGLPVAEVAARTRLSFSVGSPFFLEIAKLRAARLLWNRILEVLGVPEAGRRCHLHARTSLFNKTRLDAHSNMLRVTSEAFAAVLGGCDSLHIGPFDEVLREPDAFSRRIARNVHHILAEECDLTKVIDPVGGSYAIEHLTDQLAAAAWKIFQEIETAGGMKQALSDGLPQKWVRATMSARRGNFHRRRDILVGTNQYPEAQPRTLEPHAIDFNAIARARTDAVQAHAASRNTAQVSAALEALNAAPTPAKRIDAAIHAAGAGASLGELCEASRAATADVLEAISVEPLESRRLAEDYEELRAAAAQTGTPARILQLNIGPSRRYRLRADWTTAFFQVAGFTVEADEDFADADAAVAAVRSQKPAIAIITSDDETYAATVPALAKAVKAALPEVHLLLAGAPGENETAWKAAGIDDFIHVRVNNYEANKNLLTRLGRTLPR